MGIKSLSPVEPYYNFFAKSGDGVGPGVVANTPFTATGGTKTTGGGYTIHTFTSTGAATFVVNTGVGNVEYLVVAGGGGGAGRSGPDRLGGGGGGGGLRTNVPGVQNNGGSPLTGPSMALIPGTYTVTVGTGGAAGNAGPPDCRGGSGADSVFASITSTGGGGGGGGSGNATGRDGGSGGGSSSLASDPYNYGAGNTPPVSPPQGNPGYKSPGSTMGGGGGGAGAAAPSHVGGVGVECSISGSPVWYGGGGGASSTPASPEDGAGGNGGGGAAGPGAGNAGSNNTGGGGGTGGRSTPNPGGAGGPGIVIVRYLT